MRILDRDPITTSIVTRSRPTRTQGMSSQAFARSAEVRRAHAPASGIP
jgi:hypothetical protein